MASDRIVHLIESGALRDLGWTSTKMRQNTKRLLARWEKQQAGMSKTVTKIEYLDLKKQAAHPYADVLAAAIRDRDPTAFTTIASAPTHHLIQDARGVTLGYRVRVPAPLVEELQRSTAMLPPGEKRTTVRGSFVKRHYGFWRDYAKQPYLTAETRQQAPASMQWIRSNVSLWQYLANALRMISPTTYARYTGADKYLEPLGLTMLFCAWFGCAVNQDAVGTTGTHQDWGDTGFNCVAPWGEYEGGGLVLWQLETVMELRPGDAFFFMGSLIAHNVMNVVGSRNSIDLFSHHNVLSWKDKEDELGRGKKLSK